MTKMLGPRVAATATFFVRFLKDWRTFDVRGCGVQLTPHQTVQVRAAGWFACVCSAELFFFVLGQAKAHAVKSSSSEQSSSSSSSSSSYKDPPCSRSQCAAGTEDRM